MSAHRSRVDVCRVSVPSRTGPSAHERWPRSAAVFSPADCCNSHRQARGRNAHPPASGQVLTRTGGLSNKGQCSTSVNIYSRCLSSESARFRLTCGQVIVLMGFRRSGCVPDPFTAGRSRKHIVSDRIPTTAYVLRRVSWMPLVREFGRQLFTHGRADSGADKWVLACREPTTTPPRAWDARAIGI